MDLLLWRHAEAEDGADDLQRRLTPRGQRQAAQMARWLEARLPPDTRLLASRALRSQETLQALSRAFTIHPELDPDRNASALLQCVGWPHAGGTVLVVGHQPVLGEAVARLLAGLPQQSWPVRKGAVWWLSHRVRGGQEQTLVRTVQVPELL